MNAEERPRLAPVPGGGQPADGTPGGPETPTASGRSGGLRVLRWLVALALVAAAGWGVVESRRARALEDQVAELSTALAAAEAQVAAHREHLETIRGAVASVQERLTALEDLAAREPSPPAPASR